MSNSLVGGLIGLAATVAILRATERIASKSLSTIPRQRMIPVRIRTNDPFSREAFAIHSNFKRRF